MGVQPTITWTIADGGVGTISDSGIFSSGSSVGHATVQASYGNVSGTASITVGNAAPTVATPASAGNSTVSGTSTTLSVLGADDGGQGGLTYTWSATTLPNGSAPTFIVNGTNKSFQKHQREL